MANFWEAPTQPSLYGYRPNASIRDLILMGGQERAQAAQRSGEIWANTLGNVGQQIGQGFQAYSEEKKMARRDAATVALAQSWDGQDSNKLYTGLLKIGGAAYAEKHAPAIIAFHSKPSEDPKTELQNIYVAGKGLADPTTSPEMKEVGWQGFKNRFGPILIRRGIATKEMLDGPWTPEHEKVVGNVVNSFGQLLDIKPEKVESKVVGAGEKLIGPKGEVLFAGEPKPEKALTGFDGYLRRTYGENPTPDQELKARADYEAAGRKPIDEAAAADRATARADTRLDRSYEFSSRQLEALRKPVVDQAARFERLNETLNQQTPQADALVAPELLSVIAGGSGSGLRMNEAEISRVVGGRSNFEGIKAALNKWSLDPTKALSITPEQRKQIQSLVSAVGSKIQDRVQAFNEADQGLIGAKSVDEHHKIMAAMKSRLTSVAADTGANAGALPQPKTQVEYDALPAGAEYLSLDGKRMRKPRS